MANETLTQARARFENIAAPLQADNIVPDPYVQQWASDHYATTAAWAMPPDIPVLLDPADRGGVSTGTNTTHRSDIQDYDPWTWCQVADMVDDSRPLYGPYGEDGEATHFSPFSIVAEWGGMPYPVRDYQDQDFAVLYSPRQLSYHTSSGPAGRYYGPQQTAWEAQQGGLPQVDYWSTLILGGS